MNSNALLDALRRVHHHLLKHVRANLITMDPDELSRVVGQTAGDIIYGIDHAVDPVLTPILHEELSPLGRFLIVAEGLGESERMTIPNGIPEKDTEATIIIDPIDGTRGLMYGKRSAWILSGVALGAPADLTLEDISIALQTEIPTPRSDLSDQLSAIRGEGADLITHNLLTGETAPSKPQPTRAASIEGGFATVARYFPPGRQILASIEERLLEQVLGPAGDRAKVFEDQYICSGGCLYQLITGKDRFVADLRGVLFDKFERDGGRRGHDCHPYDMCTTLIARESGVIVKGIAGPELDAPLDTVTPVSWVGYGNESIRAETESTLQEILQQEDLI